MVRATERRRARRIRLVWAGAATLVVAALVGAGSLAAAGVWAPDAGPDAAPVSSSRGPVTDAPDLPAPSFTPLPTVTPVTAAPEPAAPSPAGFDRSANSIDDPLSPWVIVDKLRPVRDGADYSPPDLVDLPADMPNPNGYQLRDAAATALEDMFHAAKNEIGVQLVAQSGYRSYSVQVKAYDYYVNSLGVAGADLTSARPGYSEHQTGFAMDILDTVSGCSTDGRCFAGTAAYAWLQANAYRFGYVLRYPDGGTPVTGYEFEPWHWRWVGVPLATELHTDGIPTLEEFFGLPAAPDYAG